MTSQFELIRRPIKDDDRQPDRRYLFSFTHRLSQTLYTGVMAGKKQGTPDRGYEDATEATTTAVELNTTGTGAPVVQSFDLSGLPPTPDTGTPLPDDPKALKENVKGLKSQLRRRKRQVLVIYPLPAHEVYPTAGGRWVCFPQEKNLIPIGNNQLRLVCYRLASLYLKAARATFL